MEFELNFSEPICDIRIIDTLDKNGPRMSVVCRGIFRFGVCDRIEEFSCCTIDERSVDLGSFDALLRVWRRHRFG